MSMNMQSTVLSGFEEESQISQMSLLSTFATGRVITTVSGKKKDVVGKVQGKSGTHKAKQAKSVTVNPQVIKKVNKEKKKNRKIESSVTSSVESTSVSTESGSSESMSDSSKSSDSSDSSDSSAASTMDTESSTSEVQSVSSLSADPVVTDTELPKEVPTPVIATAPVSVSTPKNTMSVELARKGGNAQIGPMMQTCLVVDIIQGKNIVNEFNKKAQEVLLEVSASSGSIAKTIVISVQHALIDGNAICLFTIESDWYSEANAAVKSKIEQAFINSAGEVCPSYAQVLVNNTEGLEGIKFDLYQRSMIYSQGNGHSHEVSIDHDLSHMVEHLDKSDDKTYKENLEAFFAPYPILKLQ